MVGASGETEKEMNIYNPQIECMDRESMRALQLERPSGIHTIMWSITGISFPARA